MPKQNIKEIQSCPEHVVSYHNIEDRLRTGQLWKGCSVTAIVAAKMWESGKFSTLSLQFHALFDWDHVSNSIEVPD